MIDWTATAALLGPSGAAIAFVWNKVDKWVKGINEKLEACERRDRNSQSRREKHLAIIELLWREVDRLDPTSRALKRCKHLVDELKKETQAAGENTP